jgi:hypothetical protein
MMNRTAPGAQVLNVLDYRATVAARRLAARGYVVYRCRYWGYGVSRGSLRRGFGDLEALERFAAEVASALQR